MVKLMITSGCIFEIQSTSPNSRSYPWNIQCLSPNHFKNPIHIPYICENFNILADSCCLVSWSQSYLPINPGPAYHNVTVVPGIVCHHASWSPCAKVQPGPFEHFPSCQNLQRSFFLSHDGRRFATLQRPSLVHSTFAFLLYNRSIHRGGLYSIYDLYPVLKFVSGAKVGEINNRLNKKLVGGFNPSEKY